MECRKTMEGALNLARSAFLVRDATQKGRRRPFLSVSRLKKDGRVLVSTTRSEDQSEPLFTLCEQLNWFHRTHLRLPKRASKVDRTDVSVVSICVECFPFGYHRTLFEVVTGSAS